MELVLGVDAGGTASRAVLAGPSGVVGRGLAGPGNPISAGTAAVEEIASAIRQALGHRPPLSVRAGVLGLSGTSALADPVVGERFRRMWTGLGLTCPMTVVGDVVTAFAAGTREPSGAVLIAGTGAVAARIERLTVARVADGLGWLLGDEGSGRWLGLRAVRSAARDFGSPLAVAVAAHAGVTSADELVRWAQALPLDDITALAPVVCAAARADDPDASAIVADAVRRLVRTLDSLGSPGPVVLAGSLLTADTPVRDGLLGTLRSRGTTVTSAGDPAEAAARLAALEREPR
ncbi:BadF/BadG/BcrA/BcrD ATPase family protein [Actinoplanes oblitus]|uniref:BadF/BadG/BcrA/BcrD ATPase family protein n=1 Tax=Actinoplanes oblitus TaxID=3040509 RepID=A0ABY8WJC0_9ACTN|nr:BadF/BadG/BcrA/BcrD ATPase family protein [Actinoplanes oblitus]WIM96972.1 BadF/BadG/BcrA/BcrD ATPase family protein [Actinoplanes oblitus]